MRIMVVWFPDWPAVAAALHDRASCEVPYAVTYAHKIWVCTAQARACGVRRGTSVRDAQSVCPELVLVPRDDDRDARYFERPLAVVDDISASVEVLRPGLIALNAISLGKYYRSEERAASRIVEALAHADYECLTASADTLVAALIASQKGHNVPAGKTAEFLAPHTISQLIRAPFIADEEQGHRLCEVLPRMGISTIGDFARMPSTDIGTRFGGEVVALHRSARGEEIRPLSAMSARLDLAVEYVSDWPVNTVEQAAHIARELAERIHTKLVAQASVCIRVNIEAFTATGAGIGRVWRCDTAFLPHMIATRVRWQLDAWLSLAARDGKTLDGPICKVVITPVETCQAGELQAQLWADSHSVGTTAGQAIGRVQDMLGYHAVQQVKAIDSSTPLERAVMCDYGEHEGDVSYIPSVASLPVPLPARVPTSCTVKVLSETKAHISLSSRAELSAEPAWVVSAQRQWRIAAWSAPWLSDARWWEQPLTEKLHAYMQVQCVQGPAVLLSAQSQEDHTQWQLEAIY